ncbi:MAG: hypothetical protein VX781_02330 [Pseudomonadota bacterium]|nr:hypothetical protein [Pseudomonadota bacterium]
MSDFSINNKHYQYIAAPNLEDNSDWHDAYIMKIKRILNGKGLQNDPILVPAYPLVEYRDQSEAIFEFGSYWEGAIYYLNTVLDATTTSMQLAVVKRCINKEYTSHNETLFVKIWDSHGQLILLKAFLLREFYKYHEGCENSWEWEKAPETIPRGISTDLEWLREFILNYRDEYKKYPNPFFGGQNPLHLGLVSLEK